MVTNFPNRNKETSQSAPILEFLAVTGLPNDEESRRIVRSHAIRDANRRKRAIETNQNSAPSKQVARPFPQATFTAKFRLDGKSTRKAVAPTVVDKEKVRRKQQQKNDADIDESLQALTEAIVTRRRESMFSMSRLERLDPFDTLPIKIEAAQSALLHYQNTALKQNAFAFYSKAKLFSDASADAAWLNGTLSLISLHHDLKVGKGISRESFFYRGETLRIVNERLKSSPRDVTDYTIGAIASLANFDTTNGLFPSATMHIRGLVSIVLSRGGLQHGLLALEGNELLQKIVAWADLCYSTNWNLAPKFPLMRTPYCEADLSEFLNVFLSYFPPSTNIVISSPHDLFGEMTDIFQTLRLLTVIMSTPNISPKVQTLFTRGLYVAEYRLLVLLDQTDSRDNDIVLDRNSHIYGSTRLAAYLYLYLVLRELPPTAKLCTTLARRLRSILSGVGISDLVGVWKDDQHLLVWITFMGALTMKGSSEEYYFVDVLRKLRISLNLDTEWTFRNGLKEVLWIDDISWGRACSDIWKQLEEGDTQ